MLSVYKNRYKMAKYYTSLTFLQWFLDINHAKLVISFRGSKYLPIIWFNKIKSCESFLIWVLQTICFDRKDDEIFPYIRRFDKQAHYPKWR